MHLDAMKFAIEERVVLETREIEVRAKLGSCAPVDYIERRVTPQSHCRHRARRLHP
jgi:hypothetical protein